MHDRNPVPAFVSLGEPDLLAVLLYGEARGESLAALRAVACSVRNRVGSDRWYGGRTYHDVILKWAQYDALWPTLGGPDFTATLGFAQRLALNGYAPNPVEAKVLGMAHDCFDVLFLDVTNGATHYYDDSIPPPIWAVPPARATLGIDRLHFWTNVD